MNNSKNSLKTIKKITSVFSKNEIILWRSSAAVTLISFFIFDRQSYLTLAACLIGVTSLIFNANGNPIGQALMVIFSLLYGIISLFLLRRNAELPRNDNADGCFSLIAWLKNPYNGSRSEVKIYSLKKKDGVFG